MTSKPGIDREATLALIDAMLCGEIAPSDARDLKELLRTNEAARLLYVEYIDLEAEILRLAGHNEPPTAESIFRRPVGGRRSRLVAWSLAAVLLVVVAVVPAAWYVIDMRSHDQETQNFAAEFDSPRNGQPVVTPPEREPEPLVATLIADVDALWGETSIEPQLPVGTQWRAGEWIELTSGTAILEFHTGVRCCVTGESLLKLDADHACIVDIGTATFEVSERAIGFTVQTHGGSFVDLGTTFGVHVAEEGISEVHVLSGLVEARATKSDDEEPQVLRLTTRHSARLDPATGTIAIAKFAPEQFLTPLAVSSGVERFSGRLDFLWQPLESLMPKEQSQSDIAWLCREMSSVVLERDVAVSPSHGVDRADRGSGPGLRTPDARVIPAGTRVDSFLLHFAPNSGDEVLGSITFRSRVAGIIVSADGLTETDELFCHTETSLGLEQISQTRRGSDEPKDRVSIQGVGERVINFQLTSEVAPNLDQVRILVYSDSK